MAVTLGVAAIGGWAFATDQFSYQITRGTSMEPVYHRGDLVFVVKADSYGVGDIAAYHAPGNGPVVLHRIIGGNATGFVLKGDNNESVDPHQPTGAEMIGRAVLLVPKGGLWLGPLLSPTGLGMIGFMIVSGGAGPRTRRDIRRARRNGKVRSVSPHSPQSTGPLIVRVLHELPPRLRALACVLAAVGAVGIGLAVLGWNGPVVEQRNGVADPGQSMTFSYTATVPRTPAYDSTTVGPPDPVFRKLANTVELSLAYRGRPGSIEVAALLSTPSGWHTRIPLSATQRFARERHDMDVRLDLVALENRAEAAAKAIGVQPGPISVLVEARVTARGAAAFTPTLQLNLSPLQLALVGGTDALTVKQSATVSPGTVAPREVSLLGHRIMTAAAARSWSVFVLLGAILGAIAVVIVARRTQPLHDATTIHHRYRNLLVEVEPLTSPPGKPVINCTDFHVLVRLAERYGLLIFHWSRNNSETFVVRDEGVTYRFRTDEPAEEPPAATPVSVERAHQPT